jgi:hypothetical protein
MSRQYPERLYPDVGARVYHKGVRANGVVTAIDADKRRDTHKVEFFWAKYCKDIPHGETWGKWMWCEPSNLVETPMYYRTQFYNKVTSIGGRSLDRLIRKVCGIPRRKIRDGSDVTIVYGQSNHSLPEGIPLVINRHLIPDKYQQQLMLGDLGLPVSRTRDDFEYDFIIKPTISMGGRGIREDDGLPLNYGEYYQSKFDKCREFRVHCFLWMDEPVQMIQEKHIENKDQLTWNKKQGGNWRHRQNFWEAIKICTIRGIISLTLSTTTNLAFTLPVPIEAPLMRSFA